MTGLDLSPPNLQEVKAILRAHVPDIEVRAFGSRVAGGARKTSDLDLALMTEAPLDLDRLGALRDALSESDLPFRVDLVDWARTGEDFRRVISQRFVVLQPG
jgi:predicted nucleotidyltransferase